MSNDAKILFLESELGLEGYALFVKFLEQFAGAEGQKIPWDDVQCGIYARRFGVCTENMRRFISLATRADVDLLRVQHGYLFSMGLMRRVEFVERVHPPPTLHECTAVHNERRSRAERRRA